MCAALAACTFRPNPAGPDDSNPGGEPGPGGPGSGSGSNQRPDAAIDGPVDARVTLLPCPASYTLTDAGHPGSTYREVTASASWQAAETDCVNDQVATVTGPTHLIVLDDQPEAVFAWNQNNSDQWVGSSDLKTEGNFLPVTDQQTVFTGNATGNDGGKDCLMIHMSSGQTNADTCTNGHPYVCECDGRAENPNNF